jgi:hypothetical protein
MIIMSTKFSRGRRGALVPAAVTAALLVGAIVAGCGPATSSAASGSSATGPQAPPNSSSRAAGPCGVATAAPAYKHVIWIWFENHSYSDIIGSSSAPYFNSIATECGVAANYRNLSHPSLPNYVGATSGLAVSSLKPFTSDCDPAQPCTSAGSSIFSQGETWKAYEESMPSNCARANSGEYAVRHNPPLYFTALTTCSTDDVPYAQLASDLADNALPAFSFITPNLIDDMHDGTIAQGDSWLSSNLPAILASPEYTSGTTAVFVTFDEGAGDQAGENCATNTADNSCHVLTMVISPSTPAGSTSATLFNHYSLLATTEQLLGLPALGQAASAASMTSAFHL